MEYIVKLYNNKTFLHYIYEYDRVGDNIYYAERFNNYDDASSSVHNMIYMLYKKHADYTLSKHTYEHLKNDYFKNVNKKNLSYVIVGYDYEVRKLKLKKITNMLNERQNRNKSVGFIRVIGIKN